MLRKIVAAFLLLALVFMFVSCGKEDKETTASVPIQTGTPVSADSSTTSNSAAKPTYVLTTNQSKTVPWQDTTRFEIPTGVTAMTDNYGDISFTSGNIDKPSVSYSNAPTQPTAPSTNAPTAPSTVKPTTTTTKPTTTTQKTTTTTTKKTTTTTTQIEKEPTTLIIDSKAFDSNTNKIMLAINPYNWSSDIKANTASISVKIDGVAVAGTVTCSVTAGKNADGMQEIIIDLSQQSVSSGSVITYTIPEGFLQSKAGTQYNTSYTDSVSF